MSQLDRILGPFRQTNWGWRRVSDKDMVIQGVQKVRVFRSNYIADFTSKIVPIFHAKNCALHG